ncbi:MAG: shikimate dehydrogenase [Hyphomicrobiales bacterium]
MLKACVIGHPVSHSRSPLIHNTWLRQLGIDGLYERQDVAPQDLSSFISSLSTSSYAGCNVTLPHKEVVAGLVDVPDERVARTGSANTLFKRDGKICATTTDGEGFVQNVLWRNPGFSFSGSHVTILGAGGSSRAIIDELLLRGVDRISLVNRTLSRAEDLANLFGPKVKALALDQVKEALPTADLLVNTTSAGIASTDDFAIDLSALKPAATVADINYVPLITPFLQRASAAGHVIVPGLGMLLHQAVTGFELWFGQRPPVTEDLYNLVAADITGTGKP